MLVVGRAAEEFNFNAPVAAVVAARFEEDVKVAREVIGNLRFTSCSTSSAVG